MKQKKLEGLSIIESRYGEWMWKLISDDDSEVFADLQIVPSPREVDDYKLCGLYHKAGVPFQVYDVEHKPIEGMRVHEEIVNAYYHTTLEAIQKGNPILVAGGFCTYAPGVMGALRERAGEDKKIGILWIDAHGDIKTEKTSDNRLIAGLPLGTILGFGMERWRLSAGLKKPLDGRYVLISDYRVRTPEVVDDLVRSGISTLDTEGFNDPARWKAAVHKLADQVDMIYMHIDVDILKKEYVPTFLFPTPGGNDLSVLMDNVRVVMDTGKVMVFGVYNTCFDTDLPGKETATLTGMKIIASGLENWKEHPAI
ncbi:MAG: arginase family protein [Spirochaetales bacterium]|nr:arginase family protein [Spirochaetales bacterium]